MVWGFTESPQMPSKRHQLVRISSTATPVSCETFSNDEATLVVLSPTEDAPSKYTLLSLCAIRS